MSICHCAQYLFWPAADSVKLKPVLRPPGFMAVYNAVNKKPSHRGRMYGQ